MTEYTFDEKLVSDLHKDAYGFRPHQEFWMLWERATDEERQRIWDDMLVVLARNIDEEELREAEAISDFEASIKSAISAGAANRDDAILQVLKSLKLTESELLYGGEYACFQLGLPYRYGKELDKTVSKMIQC